MYENRKSYVLWNLIKSPIEYIFIRLKYSVLQKGSRRGRDRMVV